MTAMAFRSEGFEMLFAVVFDFGKSLRLPVVVLTLVFGALATTWGVN
jgi:hypothetical protein